MGPSDRQWQKLLDFIEDDREMRTGQFMDGSNGKARLAAKWKDAAKIINAEGPAEKSWNQWKEAYYGLRSLARQAYADQMAYMKGTGGEDCLEVADLVPNAKSATLRNCYCRRQH